MNRREHLKLLAATAATAAIPAVAWNQDTKGPAQGFETIRSAFVIDPEFTWLRFGAVKPTGWLREQMIRDLTTGFAGSLDKLCPDAGSDVFATGRSADLVARTGLTPHPAWWFGETEGNWRAGWIMMALLSEDPATIIKVDAYIAHVLEYQASDGYIGIYQGNLRYRTPGDLWTQACILRGLLAYAEAREDSKVFVAVMRCCDGILAAHPDKEVPVSTWSQGHDVMIIDVLERLYDLTGATKYRNFAVRCYEEWSAVSHGPSQLQGDEDASVDVLNDPAHTYFLGHSVRTVERLRVPIFLASATSKPDYKTAAANALLRTEPYSFLTGAIVGNGYGGPLKKRYREFINNGAPDPWTGEWEYCTARETLVTFASALQKSGKAIHAERVERVFFNAAQGGRLPDGSALSYMTPENRLSCNGRTQDGREPEARNTFSPTADEVAICCNPNGTQLSSHYVRAMWMRHRDGGLVATLYGPCLLTTEAGGTRVVIEQITNYPFGHIVVMKLEPERDAEFAVYLRRPSWSSNMTTVCQGATIRHKKDYVRLSKKWKRGDSIRLTFQPKVQVVKACNEEFALQFGALFFAMPIVAKSRTIKTYAIPGFQDSYFEPSVPEETTLTFAQSVEADPGFRVEWSRSANVLRPFDKPVLTLRGCMLRSRDGSKVDIEFVPFGNAVPLRQFTFPINKAHGAVESGGTVD